MRPGATADSIGARSTPRHDQIDESEIQQFDSLFRDSGRTNQSDDMTPPDNHPEAAAAAGLDSDSTAKLNVTYPAAMPQSDGVANQASSPAPPFSEPGSPPRAPRAPKKPRRWGRILIYILAGLLIYFSALAATFALAVNQVNAMPATQIAQTSGTNYLLVGSDGRQELTKKEQRELHVGDVEGNRTDTIMILHVPLFGQPTLISIPRDSWVPIPGHGSNKINAAFALGGPELLIETVETTTGLHVDNYVEIGMIGVARVTDALGGVELCPDRRYKDKDSNLNVKKGCQEMDGSTALAYVRMRKADPKGDIGRAERQQEYMKSATMTAMSPFTWLNPFKMFSVAITAGDSLTVDEGTGVVDDARMAMAMGMISMGWGESTTVPISSDSYWVNGQQAVKWDTPAALALFDSIGGG
jgi:LCP family protein required for cell wall assembly